MVERLRLALVLSILLPGLWSCGPRLLDWSPDNYTVKEGDTLYSIAWRYNLDYHEVARWNRLPSNYLIRPGQTLRLAPPDGDDASRASASRSATSTSRSTAGSRGSSSGIRARPARRSAQPAPRWTWPAQGKVVVAYGQKGGIGQGIDLAGKLGDAVVAAADGKVVYAGSGLAVYGRLIIIKHNDSFLSAYGHNNALHVKEGDIVKSGQRVAAMGEGPGRRPVLHFEIRRNGEPVNPLAYLPRR